jgi:hypothetical protein
MEVFKIAAKLFVADDSFPHDQFIPIFHRWIQSQSVEGHLLIDVADYAHVVAGPGTVLVSSQANFHMDRGENRLGLFYWRKLPLPGTFSQRLSAVLAETIKAAMKLEAEPALDGRLKFKTNEILIRFNDRLLAPNTPQTFAAIKDDLQAVGGKLFGGKAFSMKTNDSPLSLFEVRLLCEQAPPISELARNIQ